MMETTRLTGHTVRILVAGGDCMLGRAVQLTFPVQSPGEELIRDSCTAQHYVDLCLNHPPSTTSSGNEKPPDLSEIRRRNADNGSYLWGDYSNLKITPPPDLKLLNLETAVTKSIHNADVPKWKGIRYHMHVDNFKPILESGFQQAGISGMNEDNKRSVAPMVVSCANNHIMDYGRKAMEEETFPLLDSVKKSNPNFYTVGCGRTISDASQPAFVNLLNNTVQATIVGFAAGCSGTPQEWWATTKQSGLLGLPPLRSLQQVDAAMRIAREAFAAAKQQQTSSSGGASPQQHQLTIASIHWGPNWALRGETAEHDIAARRTLAHRLVDECGVDLVYGHSSHHARGMEIYKNKLILYGTGDIINDYEGFENPGEETYNCMGGLFLVDLDATTGNAEQLRIVPMYMDRLSLRRYSPDSQIWQPFNPARRDADPSGTDEDKCLSWCSFLNHWSSVDAGSSNGAVKLEYCENDPQIEPSSGPILRAQFTK